MTDRSEYVEGGPVWQSLGIAGEKVVRFADPFYGSDEWRKLRYQALKLNAGCCQCCGQRASRDRPLHVDHIKPRSKYPELELALSNLQVLCEDCNLGKGAWDETDWRSPQQARAAEIIATQTPNGGWTKEQLAAWGVPWPPPPGWRQRLEAAE
jgi:hypothetical protein